MRFIALVDEQGRELACVSEFSSLPEREQQLLAEAIKLREFVPVIQKICQLVLDAGRSEWKVVTDRGPATFVLDQEDHLRNLPEGRLLLTDSHGGRYCIENIAKLDEESRHLLTRIC